MKRCFVRILSGALLMVVPPVAMFVFFIVSILGNGGPKNQFLAPGSLEIDISEPGRYYLWHDYATLYRNHRYSLDPSLPNGLEISVKDANGLPLEFVSRSGMSANVGDYSKSSVRYVEIDDPVSLRIDISGDFEDRVLSFSPGIFDSIGIGFFVGIPSAMALSVAGVILLVVGLVDYSKSRMETKDQERGSA